MFHSKIRIAAVGPNRDGFLKLWKIDRLGSLIVCWFEFLVVGWLGKSDGSGRTDGTHL